MTTNEIKFSFVVEDWNEVEMPEEIGPGDELDSEAQAALNAKLMVNMFTEYNAKEFSLDGKTITSFYDKLTVDFAECPTSSYVTWSDLEAANDALTAEFTRPDGVKYRLPTAGELALLSPMYSTEHATVNKENDGVFYPFWNDNPATNEYPMVMVPTPFTETIYLKNDGNHYPDKTHPNDIEYTLTGVSQLAIGEQTEEVTRPGNSYNIHPAYGLRFKGTDQYAAYRWEMCRIKPEEDKYYFSIKIKALHPQDNKTTIQDVAQQSFWTTGSYIEFQFPAAGAYQLGVTPNPDSDNIHERGDICYCWSSSKVDETYAYSWKGYLTSTFVTPNYEFGFRFPLRFVKVDAQQ